MPDYKLRIVVEGKDSNASDVMQGVEKSVKRLDSAVSGFGGKMSTAFVGQMEAAEKRLDKISDALTGFGGTLSAAVTAPLAGLGAAALKMTTDLNRTMANVASLGVGTDRIFELRDAVQELAISTGKGTDDIADGLYQVISTFEDTADTTKILDIVARSAAAGLATTTDAINLTASVSKSYNDTSVETIQKINDLAFATANLGITTLPEMARNIGQAAPLASALGVSMEDMFAVIATGAGITGSTSEVTTQFRGILQSFLAPTTEATRLIKAMGYQNGIAMVKTLGLQKSIELMVAAADATNQPLQAFIGSIEGQTLAMALTGEQSETFTQRLEDMQNVTGQMDAAFEAQTQGVNKFGFAMQQARVKLQVFFEDLGDALGPVAMEFVGWLEPMLAKLLDLGKAFATLNPETRRTVIIFAGVAAAIGPVLVGVGALAAGIASAMPVIAGLGGALLSIVSPLGLVAAGFATLYALDIGGIGTAVNEFGTAAVEVAGNLANYVAAVADAGFASSEARQAINLLPQAVQPLAAAIDRTARGLIDYASAATSAGAGSIEAQIAIGGLPPALIPLVSALDQTVGGLVAYASAVANAGAGTTEAHSAIMLLPAALQPIMGAIDTLAARLSTAFGKMTTELGALGPSFQRLSEAAAPVLQGLGQAATVVGGAIAVAFGGFAISAINLLAATFENLATIVEASIGSVTAMLTLVSTIVSGMVTGVTAAINGDWATVWQSAKDIMQAFVDFGQSVFSNFLITLGATVAIIGTTISTTLSDLGFTQVAAQVEAATQKVQTFVEWLGKIVSGEVSINFTQPAWVEKLLSWIPDAPGWVTDLAVWLAPKPEWVTSLIDWIPATPAWLESLLNWTPSTPAWLENLLNWRPPSIQLPSFFGGGGFASEGSIGGNAQGTNNWRGGWTWVGEKGPELLNLPKGSQVISNRESMGMIGQLASGTPGAAGAFGAGFDSYVTGFLAKQAEKDRSQAEKDAEKLAKTLERAIEKQTEKLRSVLQSVPGLFGASTVTQEQMDLAKMGVDQNFADNYLRRLTDEVMNGVDWEGVDLMDAAAAAGIDPNLPAEAILTMFKAAWQDSSLFANPENLKFIDQSAVAEAQARAAASEQGKANIFALFGIPPEEATAQGVALGGAVRTGLTQGIAGGTEGVGVGKSLVDGMVGEITPETMAPVTSAMLTGLEGATKDGNTDLGGAFVNVLTNQLSGTEDNPFAGIASTIMNKIAAAWNTGDFGIDIIGPMANAMKTQLGLADAVEALNSVGEAIADAVFKGYQEAVKGMDWVSSVPATASATASAIPGNASGTSFWRGGMTWVGERGPELVELPRGSRVYSAQESRGMARNGGGDTIINNFYVSNNLDIQSAAHKIEDIRRRRGR